MLDDHPIYIKPNEGENLTLWRYISIDKFESLLEKSSIYFCNTYKLAQKEDPFEGSIPFREKKWIEKNGLESLSKFSKNFRKSVYVNCWHINETESAAMWKLYLKDFNGIAIRSNYLRLKDCLNESQIDLNHPRSSKLKIGMSRIRYQCRLLKGISDWF